MAIQTREHEVASGAVDLRFDFDKNNMHQALLAIQIKLSAVPTSTGAVEITLKSKRGTSHDVSLFSDDPSTGTAVDSYVVTMPDYPLPIENGDSLQVEYPNSDNLNFSAVVKYSDSYY